MSEVVFHREYYEPFATDDQDVVAGICRFVFDKDYNTDTCDLLLFALSNAFQITVKIFQYEEGTRRYREIKLTPGRKEVLPTQSISLVRKGEGAAAHYSALIPHLQNQSPAQSCSATFSPESVLPHPKAPPRKNQTSKGRRKRKSAILTDTPVKKALEEEQQGRQKKKSSKAKSSSRGQGPKAKNLGKSKGAMKSKARKSLDYGSPPSSEEEEDDVCIICLSPWSASKKGEEWIQCTQCKNWAHVECAGLALKSPVYICHNCNSDADSMYMY